MRQYEYDENGNVVKKIITCNQCGKYKIYNKAELAIYLDYGNKMNNIEYNFSYGSSFDLQEWQYDLCEKCLLEHIKSFKYVPKGFMDNGSLQLSDEQRQKLFENWKNTNEWDELSVLSYDELVDLVGYFDVEYINNAILKHHPDRKLIE